MARMPYYFDPATASEADVERYKNLQPLNILRLMGHAGPLLEAFVQFGNGFFVTGELDPKLRQMVILRVGIRSDAPYELHQHLAVSRTIGVSEEQIARAMSDSGGAASDLEGLVLAFTDQVIAATAPTDETFEAVAGHLSPRSLQELVLLIGYYMLICRFLNTFQVDIEGPGQKVDFLKGVDSQKDGK